MLQPSYLPWLGYLDQIARCDAFVFYDDVQYDKNGWRNRNRIRTNSEQGWSWLTIPVRLETSFPRLDSVTTDERVPWRRKHRDSIRSAYSRCAHLDLLETVFADFFNGSETRLVDIAIDSIKCLMKAFDIATPLHRSSELLIGGDRNERLLAICKALRADHYLSGDAAKDYLDVDLFRQHDIEVEWQTYEHPEYQQRFQPFVSHLSALDALLNLGTSARSLIART